MRFDINSVLSGINRQKIKDKKITLVTGVFDVLHQEHSLFLSKAKAIGNYLLVGLESDVRVKKIKGKNRPINNENKRVSNLNLLNIADAVFILPEKFDKPEEHEAVIKQIKPSILAVSSHTKHIKEKEVIMEKYKGKVVVIHDHNPEISSTIILKGQKN